MRKLIFSLSCSLFIVCAGLVVLPIIDTVLGLMSVDTGAQVFAYLIAYGPFYTLALFVSFVGINALSE